jgi:hypothetical protein
MVRYPFESEYLYGLHDPGGQHVMAEGGCKGWVLVTEELGNDPSSDYFGNYTALSDAGFGVMVRLNNGYYGPGTLPFSRDYERFAQRCASFVRNSPGAHIWIIGNEMNMAAERPGARIDWSRNLEVVPRGGDTPSERELGRLLSVTAALPRGTQVIVDPGETITPELYVRCYTRCRNAIRSLAGHEGDLVLTGAVAPWNDNTGPWIEYFKEILTMLGPQMCDGIALHTYTHGRDPALIHNDYFMDPPYQHCQFNFRTYRDFSHAIPTDMRRLPVYVTETDQDDVWEDNPREWLRLAYGEIDWWNRQPGNQQIRALILYRWQDHDRWVIQGKQGVIDAFKSVMQSGYRWNPDAVL